MRMIAHNLRSQTAWHYRSQPVTVTFDPGERYGFLNRFLGKQDQHMRSVKESSMNRFTSLVGCFDDCWGSLWHLIPIAYRLTSTAFQYPAVSSLEAYQTPAH
jgi:hypothetical protein